MTWRCPLCGVVVGHWSPAALAAKVRKHARSAHPDRVSEK